MKSRDMKIAEVVRDACIKELGGSLAIACDADALVDLAAIIAHVESPEPVAWRVMVRRADTEWRQYALYETGKAASNTARKIEGDPLQVMVQPLYTSPPTAEINRQLLDVETKRFLTDVITAAGLLYYGKKDKGLSSRINEHAALLLTTIAAEQQAQPEPQILPEAVITAMQQLDRTYAKTWKVSSPSAFVCGNVNVQLLGTVLDHLRAILAAAEAKRGG